MKHKLSCINRYTDNDADDIIIQNAKAFNFNLLNTCLIFINLPHMV